jgi:hypothetical protein
MVFRELSIPRLAGQLAWGPQMGLGNLTFVAFDSRGANMKKSQHSQLVVDGLVYVYSPTLS